MIEKMIINRRTLLGAACVGGMTLAASGLAFANASTHRRMIFILQRGAADGLGILAPTGDPDFERVRGALAAGYDTGFPLDGFFTLHPSLSNVRDIYKAGQFLPVHAVATNYRERSHFDGQNLLEGGGIRPYARGDGWLNRLVGMLPEGGRRGIALSQTLPLALRGQNRATSYAPSKFPDPGTDLLDRVASLYENDPLLDELWAEAIRTREIADTSNGGGTRNGKALAKLAASFLSADDGPRIAMIETGGWDTHRSQAGRLGARLQELDIMIGGLRDNLGGLWDDTLVMVATEFGRTARINGTKGTDHGTASLAMLAGGKVKGGRVLSDWPGLNQASLFENRDLKPTLSLQSLIANATASHFGLDPSLASKTLFPGLSPGRMPALLRS